MDESESPDTGGDAPNYERPPQEIPAGDEASRLALENALYSASTSPALAAQRRMDLEWVASVTAAPSRDGSVLDMPVCGEPSGDGRACVLEVGHQDPFHFAPAVPPLREQAEEQAVADAGVIPMRPLVTVDERRRYADGQWGTFPMREIVTGKHDWARGDANDWRCPVCLVETKDPNVVQQTLGECTGG
jgi:hypothetical protein